MSLLVFIVVLFIGGLIIGGLARLIVPGPDPMSIPMTALLGLGGSLIGGLISRIFLGYAGGFLFAVLGAVILVLLRRHFGRQRSPR